MNSPTCIRIHFKFTMFFANSPWVFIANWQSTCAFLRIFNSLSFSGIYFQFTVFITKPTMIHYLFGEITLDWLTISWIKYKFPIFFANLLRIHNLFRELISKSLFFRKFTLHSLSSLIHFEFTIFFTISLRILYFFSFHFIFPLHFANSLTIPFEFKNYEFTICFANSLLIHYIFRRFTLDSHRIFYLLRECTLNSPFISRMNIVFTLFFANSLKNSLWIQFAMPSPYFSRSHFESTLSLSLSRFHFEITIFCKFTFFQLNTFYREFIM